MSDFSTFSQMTCAIGRWLARNEGNDAECSRELKENEGDMEDHLESRERKTYWDTVCVFLSDSLRFGLALFERVLVLEFGAHFRF